jgi:hypothetical protein
MRRFGSVGMHIGQALTGLQSYEQAAADAAPAYWETTILAPGMSPDEIYIEGLPVGSFFAFVWNAMSMCHTQEMLQ